MYTPPNSVNLKDVTSSRLFVGLQGAPATGKTTAALTFPNPVVLDFDHGLAAHYGKRTDVLTIPFWDEKFCDALIARKHSAFPPNRRDALMIWLKANANKFESNQTLILDSWTFVQDAFDHQTELEPAVDAGGKENPFVFWERKIEYAEKILTILKNLSCNVVVTFHEVQRRDEKTGILLEKIQPLMQGKFVARIAGFFDEFYRTVVTAKLNKDNKHIGAEYFWQVRSDDKFNAKTMMKSEIGPLVKAHYDSIKY